MILQLLVFVRSAHALVACEALFRPGEPGAVMRGDLSHEARELVARKWQGISDRGFVSSKIRASGALSAEVAKEGLLWWYLRVFVVESVEAAKVHSAKQKDPLMQGVYLINKGQTAEQTAALIHQPAPDVFNRMLKNDAMYFFRVKENNAVEIVPPDLIDRNIAINELTWDLNDSESGPYIMSPGWAFPRYRGMIKHEAGIDSKTYHRMRNLAKQLVAKGFTIRFNHDFVRALNMVRDQERKIEGKWVENSLYAGENNQNYAMTLESYQAGRAYSVEVWNEKNELVGGVIGFRDGAMYSPESTFYNKVDYPKISIGFARIGIVALMDRLKAAGITWADAGMVTPFTESMKGELVTISEFLDDVAKLPPEAEVDLITNWTP